MSCAPHRRGPCEHARLLVALHIAPQIATTALSGFSQTRNRARIVKHNARTNCRNRLLMRVSRSLLARTYVTT
jgi:hypothetical protein